MTRAVSLSAPYPDPTGLPFLSVLCFFSILCIGADRVLQNSIESCSAGPVATGILVVVMAYKGILLVCVLLDCVCFVSCSLLCAGEQIFGAWLAYQVRNVDIPALNDSKYIGQPLSLSLILCLPVSHTALCCQVSPFTTCSPSRPLWSPCHFSSRLTLMYVSLSVSLSLCLCCVGFSLNPSLTF